MTTEERTNEIVSYLQGTCNSTDSVLTEEELDDLETLQAIDEQIFCCVTCGWWKEINEICAGCEEETSEWSCDECCPNESHKDH